MLNVRALRAGTLISLSLPDLFEASSRANPHSLA
jgi:hypothetical protein